MIVGFEWVFVSLFAAAMVACLWLMVSVQGDLIDDTKRGPNSDKDAKRMFLDLVRATRQEIVIHDDGEDTEGSVYNSDQVLAAFKDQIDAHDIKVRCLFNEEEQDLKLLRLARDYPDNIEVFYMKGGRPPEPDTHYKIVDGGKLVHLSRHKPLQKERMYVLRKPPAWATKGSRRRISQAYVDNFNYGLRAAIPARI